MSKKAVQLDVREDLARGREPFGKIMRAAAGLQPGEDLLLVAPFEPTPLYSVLGQQGFSHRSTPRDDGAWEIRFIREAESERGAVVVPPPSPGVSERRSEAVAGAPVVEVDARGLEPPQPLMKILEALAALPEGSDLRALTDRRPMHLYAHLEERGYAGETIEQADGSFVTHVHRV